MLYDKASAYLAERAIPESIGAAASIGITDNAQTHDESFHPIPALVIPYMESNGQPTGFVRVRYFDPPEVGGVRKKRIRYQQPKGSAPEVYLPPLQDWDAVLADPEHPIIITEGEFKSLSVMHNTGMPCMGLGGVFMFADNKATLPTLERTVWRRRRVYIVFDSDIDTKIGVQLAESRLAQWLLKQRAVVHTCRLPPALDGGKQGADDFIAACGAESFTLALKAARSLTDLDLRVLELNQEVAYLDAEEKLIEVQTGNMLRKDSFVSGSRYSTIKVPVQVGDKLKMESVASAWLTHPMATRYTDTLFRPGGSEIIRENNDTYLNSWTEQPCRAGDVDLFLNLTQFIFGETLDEGWDWPLKLLAFKVQNQLRKIPLAIMLIGEQGSGKSLWTALARSAFGAYGPSRSGKDLGQDWNGFLEKGLLVSVDDVSTRQMRSNIETLRSWISEPRFERHEKFMKNREVSNYALLIFTSNYRDAGAFAHDDRRFLVVGCPRRDRGSDYYDPIWKWLYSGDAGASIYHYLLNYDLQGWEPPVAAPLTAEKRMAYEESLSAFEKLARDMMTSDTHVVISWLRMAEQWALGVIGSPGHQDTPRANEILVAIQAFPIRPWYTADELCNMFPHMLRDLEFETRRWSNATMPGRVSTSLRNHGIYFLKNTDNPDGFMWRGRLQQFLIICPSAPYSKRMSQAEFDTAMAEMGNYQPVGFGG